MVFRNGNVAAIDDKGKQIPELQGSFTDVVRKILDRATPETTFHGWPDIEDNGCLGDRRSLYDEARRIG